MSDGPAAFILEGGYVLTLDDDDTRGRLSVAVQDGAVVAIGGRDEVRQRLPRAARVSCSGRIIMPGLINAHLHPELHLMKGALEDIGLHDWSNARFYNDAVAFMGTADGRAAQQDAMLAAVAESALGGVTAIGMYGVTANSEDASARALDTVGLRGTLTIRDVSFSPHTSAHSAFYRLHAEEALFEPELQAAAAAHARGERIVMHAAETPHRIRLAQERFGMSTVRLLASRGLLSPRVLLSHAVHVDDEEIDMIARSGACIVVSPAAEMKLGDGIPPVTALLARGVTVALGTDAAVCNNSSDMFLEMRLLGLSQKLRYGPAAMTAEQILLMATRHGAAALGPAAGPGRIAEAAPADMILVDTRGPRIQPLVHDGPGSNVAANLVYAATASDVTDVMVNGRWIVRRRRLLTTRAHRTWQRLARHANLLDGQLRSKSHTGW